MEWKTIKTTHEDLIHDVSYDYYGRRLATCSSDLRVKVFDYDDITAEWIENDSWKSANAAILKVIWANPKVGQVIAICSIDRTVRIFEEQEHEAKNSGKRWHEKARLVDSRGAVLDIWFAPIHYGLKLASVSADAVIRIYEALSPNDLSQWTLMDDIILLSNPPPRDTESSFCLTWCPSRWDDQQLLVGAMNTVCIYRQNANNKWKAEESLDGHTDLVRDVTWGANMGRSYHIIATACKDGHVRIFKLTNKLNRFSNEDVIYNSEPIQAKKGYIIELVGDFDDHMAQVWRVSFNVTGTILSSAGDDGRIRLWKANYAGDYQCLTVISMEKTQKDDIIEE
ncbi:hypothetical protein PNEG_01975 [Pneumocystis murina B123]|uniref:Uncharacterized protein n=1 Tax=Pneumocystis murina (strain B123) TaxID=1069680 RepID=M7NRC0_PNEMU|nr:hypothetical protein PNEG_01975 [Pneumocystis murina B123]EMR09792.1 hypothetical protein PNEG_01975 [Pneumocystis murina B123]